MEYFDKHMMVYGNVVRCEYINKAIEECDIERGSHGLIEGLYRYGGHLDNVSYRCADRILQSLRKRGFIEFKNRKWQWCK